MATTLHTSYIRAGWLFDGSGNPARRDLLMTVDGGIITSLEPFSKGLGVDRTRITDLSDCTLLPPLIDSHVHLFMSGCTDKIVRKTQLTAGYEELRPVMRQHLSDLFNHGVLAVRDGGDRGGFARRYLQEERVIPGQTVIVSGRAYHEKGRYGGLIGRHPENGSLISAYRDDPEQKEFVKIVNSGLNSLNVFGRETPPQFDVETLKEVVGVAREKGQRVMVHANGREAVRIAVEAGCDSIEHGFFMGEENLKRMADRGTSWVPTLFTMKAYGANLAPGEVGVDHQVLQKNVDHQVEQLHRARELGVDVILGTDAGSLGVLHGEAVSEEMKLFKKAGYTLGEIIRSATAGGAKLLGLDGFKLGPGNAATFIVARGTPSLLPRKLTYLENIYIDGSPSDHYRKNPVKHVQQQ